jgi:hypothetical protein
MRHTLHLPQIQHHTPPNRHFTRTKWTASRRARPKLTLHYVLSATSQLTANTFLHDSRRGPSEECWACTIRRMQITSWPAYIPRPQATNSFTRLLVETAHRALFIHICYVSMLWKTDVIPLFPFLFPSNGYLFTCTDLTPHYSLYTVVVFLFQLFVNYEIISH